MLLRVLYKIVGVRVAQHWSKFDNRANIPVSDELHLYTVRETIHRTIQLKVKHSE